MIFKSFKWFLKQICVFTVERNSLVAPNLFGPPPALPKNMINFHE